MFIYRVQQIAIRLKLFHRFVEERRDQRIENLSVILCVFGQECLIGVPRSRATWRQRGLNLGFHRSSYWKIDRGSILMCYLDDT